MVSLATSPLIASVRKALGEDRVVRAALQRAQDLTGCPIIMLHAGIGNTQLCVARHRRDIDERIRRAMIRGVDLGVADIQAHTDVQRFPKEAPRDLFDPLAIRAYAAVPFRARQGVEGALHCLDESPRAFTEEQLRDVEALCFTICGRLVPTEPVGGGTGMGLACRLRSLRARLEPVGTLLLDRPRLSHSWQDLGQAIEQAASELDAHDDHGFGDHAA